MALLSSCTTAPDRQEETDRVTAAMEQTTGVANAYGFYSNDLTQGSSYSLRLTLTAGAGSTTVASISRAYADQIGSAGLTGHSLRLEITTADREDRITLHASRGNALDPTAETATWIDLVEQIPGIVTVDGYPGEADIRVETDDLVSTLDDLRVPAAARMDRPWVVRAPKLVLHLDGGVPDPETATSLALLVDTAQRWEATYDPLASPAISTLVANDEVGAAQEQAARDHLDLVRQLGVPVAHTEDLPDGEVLEVAVGGCRTDGEALQQQLNRDYGTC